MPIAKFNQYRPEIWRVRLEMFEVIKIKHLLLAPLLIVLTGCSSGLQVTQLENFTPESREFVLLTSGEFDSKVRVSLAKYGFKLKKFSSTTTVAKTNIEAAQTEIYEKAEARYGLSFYYSKQLQCAWNSEWVIEGTYEVTDLRTNDVLLIITKGGLTGSCRDLRDHVFPELAAALNSSWR